MTAAQPTIIATSISFNRTAGSVWDGEAGAAYHLVITLARAGKHPRICVLATGLGDNPIYLAAFHSAFSELDLLVSHLALFPVPSVPDIREHLLGQDLIWVAGGSTAKPAGGLAPARARYDPARVLAGGNRADGHVGWIGLLALLTPGGCRCGRC
jgi:hypothetical protein